MRSLAWITLLCACGSSPPRRDPQPALEAPSEPPRSGSAAAEVVTLADLGCVAPGAWAVTVDVSTADVATTGATPRDTCVDLAGRVTEHQSLTITADAGQPRVAWNGEQAVTVLDACAIELRGAAGTAQVAFRNGRGKGGIDLALGETCVARGARLELVRAP